jgi:hypothetical protein
MTSDSQAVSMSLCWVYTSVLPVVQALDADSRGKHFAMARRLGLDVHCNSLAVHLGTMPSELVSASAVCVTGSTVIARLESRPPYTVTLPLSATSWHTVLASMPARNCRPPPKAYTDVTAKVTGLVVGLSAGLEPALGALRRAAQRVILPTNVTSDAGVAPVDPGAPGLPWWDKLRCQWRGRLRLMLSDASIVTSISLEPAAAAHHDRVSAIFRKLELAFEPEGQLQVTTTGLCMDAFLPHMVARSRPGAPHLRVPLLKAAAVRLALVAMFVLPGGRDPGNHHVFPPLDDTATAAKQGPIDTASLFRSESFSLSVDVCVGTVADCGQV